LKTKDKKNKKKEADGFLSDMTFIIKEVNQICCSKGPQEVPARPSGQEK